MKDIFSIPKEALACNGFMNKRRESLFNDHIVNTIYEAERFHSKISSACILEVQDFALIGLHELWKATERYEKNDSRGASFWTFARTRITGSMYDELRAVDIVSRLDRERISSIEKNRRKLQQEQGRIVSFREASNSLEIEDPQLEELSKVNFMPLDATFSDIKPSGHSSEKTVGEMVADPNWIHPASINEEQNKQTVLEEVLEKLNSIDRLLIKLYFWSNIPLAEIAKCYGFTESRASQRLAQALSTLKKLLKNKEL